MNAGDTTGKSAPWTLEGLGSWILIYPRTCLKESVRTSVYGCETLLDLPTTTTDHVANTIGGLVEVVVDGAVLAAGEHYLGPPGLVASGAVSGIVCPVAEAAAAEVVYGVADIASTIQDSLLPGATRQDRRAALLAVVDAPSDLCTRAAIGVRLRIQKRCLDRRRIVAG